MKLKKALGIVLALAMVLTLAACGAAPAQETQAPETAAPAANAETTAAAAEPGPEKKRPPRKSSAV